MTEQPKPNDSTRDVAIRSDCLEMSIRAGCGQCYDTDGRMIFDAGEIVKAASMFEGFIKNTLPIRATTEALKDQKETW